MLNITNGELWALNILNNAINLAQQELQRTIASKAAYVKLIETKYNVELDAETNEFKPKRKEKE